MKPPSKCRQMPAKSFTIAEAAEKDSSLSVVTAVCSALTAQCRVRQSRKIKLVVLETASCPLMAAGLTGRRNTHCPGGKDGVFDDTSRIFSRLHCGRANGDFEIAGIGHNTLGFKPQ